MATNISATTLNLAKTPKKYSNLKQKSPDINNLGKSGNNIDTHEKVAQNNEQIAKITNINKTVTPKNDSLNLAKRVEVPQNDTITVNKQEIEDFNPAKDKKCRTIRGILTNKLHNDNLNPVTGTKEVDISSNSVNKVFLKKQIGEKASDWPDSVALDSGEVPATSATSKPVIADVKSGSNGRILIIKSKTGKAIKLMTRNPIIVQAKQELPKSEKKVTFAPDPDSEISPNVIKKVITSATISVTTTNPVQTTSTITTNLTKHVQISLASSATSPNVIQKVSTITTNVVSSQNVPKPILNPATDTEIPPNVKPTYTNTSKKVADADRTDIFPLKIPYAANKALQFTLTSKLQKVPEFHMLRIANGSPKVTTTPIKEFAYPRAPITPPPKAIRTRPSPRSLIKVMVVDSATQTEPLPVSVQHTGTQTTSDASSPARTDELPDIKDLVKYLLDNPEYSAGIDDCKKSDLLDMSETIMRAKMFPVPCKVSVKPNTYADNLKMQLFCDLKDCVNFDLLGNLPIHNAILENHISNVKRQCYALRLRNISVNIENNERLIPLQMAVLNNCDTEIIKTLLEYGGDTNAKDHEGSTVVHLTVFHSTDYNLELVLKHSAALQYLINLKNDEGVTPLILAAMSSKADMVEVLLNHGADPNLRDEKSGRTALFHAVEVNAKFVINSLLKFKADTKIRNFFGLTAVDAARDLDIIDTNLDPPAPPNDTISLANRVVAQENSNRRGQKRPAAPKAEPVKKANFGFKTTYRKVDLKQVSNTNKRNGI